MKRAVFVFLAVTVLLMAPALVGFSQQHEMEKSPATGAQGMMGEGMGMMCPMMGMMGGMGGDPKMMGRMMEMRGEMMIKMGEVMIKHAKMMQKEGIKQEPKKSM